MQTNEFPLRFARPMPGPKLAELQLRNRMLRLSLRNWITNSPVISPAGPVVSITSFGNRIRTVHLTIESIGQGDVLPSRLILWLDDRAQFERLVPALIRLKRRGLEVKLCANYGPYKKFYPYVESHEAFKSPLVTADDDVLYPKDWLKRLLDGHLQYPDNINCFRARTISVDGNKICQYKDWQLCDTSQSSFRNIATGVSGVIYPASFLPILKTAGVGFQDKCPRNDDLWLHVQAIRHGYRIRQIGTVSVEFPAIPGSQEVSLWTTNKRGGNDEQVQATYTADDIRILREEGSLGKPPEAAPEHADLRSDV